ncbi:hypothetical protein RQP46_000122 [Phenoliferia psychrophenolica]
MSYIDQLAPELKADIMEMVAEQDDAFKRRWDEDVTFAGGCTASNAETLIETRWHGRGINALFQVSKEWSLLAEPFVFKTLRASRVLQPWFTYHILATLWHLALPNIKTITVDFNMAEVLAGALFEIGGIATDLFTREALVELLSPITSLTLEGISIDQDDFGKLIRHFTNLRNLEFKDTRAFWFEDNSEATAAIDELAHLDRLQLGVRPMSGEDLEWEEWSPATRVLEVTALMLDDVFWVFLSTLAARSQEVILHIERGHQLTYQPPPTSFPHLSKLTVDAHAKIVHRVLLAFDPVPNLHSLQIHEHQPVSIPPHLNIPTIRTTIFSDISPTWDTGEPVERERTPSAAAMSEVRTVRTWLPFDREPEEGDEPESFELAFYASHTTGLLRVTEVALARHQQNEDVVASATLMRALDGLRAFFALERD